MILDPSGSTKNANKNANKTWTKWLQLGMVLAVIRSGVVGSQKNKPSSGTSDSDKNANLTDGDKVH